MKSLYVRGKNCQSQHTRLRTQKHHSMRRRRGTLNVQGGRQDPELGVSCSRSTYRTAEELKAGLSPDMATVVNEAVGGGNGNFPLQRRESVGW